MGRPRNRPEERLPGPRRKFSLALPSDLAERAERACDEAGLTVSELIRRALSDYLDRPGQPGSEARLVLSPAPELAHALAVAGRLAGLDPAAVAQLLVADHIAGFIAQAREHLAGLRRVADEAGPPPADAS
jgi:hypothetical protein